MMSTGSTWTFSRTTTRILAVALLFSFIPGVTADCWVDSSGREFCNGLSDVARVGIGIGFFLLFLAVIFSLYGYRRRRAAQANLAYIHQTQPGGGAAYGGPYGYGGGPQYPPQAYNGISPPVYDPTMGFASPVHSPPQYYVPPPGAPPPRHK